uniref:Glutathione peroxidase n=1 Tax=Euplotes harpa TaxID=151035 RepID=A0A7S3JGD9_9SPIT|mmetsp:Transcript_34275/g.39593  ORF Transcript_34275/g.39593 Transcript_34275/m.39593 type:complete len:123 (+) Transcript_34275:31-399(+)
MVKIYETYKDKGFQIFAFPCNQFMSQEPGSNQDIKEFAQDKYGATFPLFSKIDVNGPNSHEVFKFCRRYSPLYDEKKDTIKSIPWNFAKFLIDENGQVVDYYTPKQNPDECLPKIEKMLGLK